MKFDKLSNTLRLAIIGFEIELESRYNNPEELHADVMDWLELSEEEYLEIMGRPYEWSEADYYAINDEREGCST